MHLQDMYVQSDICINYIDVDYFIELVIIFDNFFNNVN